MSEVMLQKLYKQEELIKQQIQCEIKQIQLDNDIKALQLERKKISDEQKRLEQPISNEQKEFEQVFKEDCEVIKCNLINDYGLIFNGERMSSCSSSMDNTFGGGYTFLHCLRGANIIENVENTIAIIKKNFPYVENVEQNVKILYKENIINPSIAIIIFSTQGMYVYRVKSVPISRTICINYRDANYSYLHDDDEYDINEVVYRFDWKNPDTNRFRRKFIKFMST